MTHDTLTRAGRSGALTAAPLGAVSLGLMIFAETTGRSMASPLAVAAGAAGLAATVALLLGLVWLHADTRERSHGVGAGALLVALVGAALTVGAVWSLVFVAPSLGARYPGLLDEPLPGVVVGYVVSHLVLGVGILAWAVAARRAGLITPMAGRVLVAGGLLCMTPLPARYLVVAVGLLLVARAPGEMRGASMEDRTATPAAAVPGTSR